MTVYAERSKVFKALCDERRQRILELLRSGEKCACVLIEEKMRPQAGRNPLAAIIIEDVSY